MRHSIADIVRTWSEFDDFGLATKTIEREGIRYFVNEFWTAKQRQAHRLHEISYRACFKAQLPEFFIQHLTNPGDTVCDPFMGRGTTLLQAALMGRRPVGNDVNPLAPMLIAPRLTPPSLDDIRHRLKGINWSYDGPLTEELLVFYHPETLVQLEALRLHFSRQEKLDLVDSWIRMVAINRLTGHSAGFFSVYSLPPNQAVSIASQRKINRKREQVPPLRDVPELIAKKSKALLSQGALSLLSDPLLGVGSAESMNHIEDNSVDLIVTSPPFLDIVQYAKDNWLRCWFAGIELDEVKIAHYRSIEDWKSFVHRCFTEFLRILKPKGYVAFEVGEVRNQEVRLEEVVLQAIQDLSYNVLGVLVHEQEFTKTSHCWGVNNNSKGTNSNRIVVVQVDDAG